jgi:hypothetical protein
MKRPGRKVPAINKLHESWFKKFGTNPSSPAIEKRPAKADFFFYINMV